MNKATVQFLTAIDNADLADSLGAGIKFDGLVLTDDPRRFSTRFRPEFRRLVGEIEYEYLMNSPVVAYGRASLDAPLSARAGIAQLGVFLGKVRRFQIATWLVRDNALAFDRGYAQVVQEGQPVAVHSNTWAGQVRALSSDRPPIAKSELDMAVDAYRYIYLEDIEQATLVDEQARDQSVHGAEHGVEGSSRMERALYFLQGGRRAPSRSLRVANFCSALEALLVAGGSELSHRLCERAAWLLEADAESRAACYARVRRAYSIRSSAVHGSAIRKKDKRQIQEVAANLDETLRQILLVILHSERLRELYLSEDAQHQEEELERKLHHMTLGDPTLLGR